MPDRIITSHSRGSSVQLVSCLSSLLALELLKPGKELYLISPWLSNMPLLDNRFGQFRALVGEENRTVLHLGNILALFAARGTQVRILYRAPVEGNTRQFVENLSNVANLECRAKRDLHAKGLITSHFYVHGSMNFTYAGIKINDESVRITRDEATIWQALQEARVMWEGVGADDLA